MAPKRFWGLAAVFAVAVEAGTMESSSGNPSVTPMPRRKVRRGSDFLVMNTAAPSTGLGRGHARGPELRAFRRQPVCKRRASYDPEDERRKPVVLRRGLSDDAA